MFRSRVNLLDVGFGYVAVLHIDSDVTHHHHLFSPTYHLDAERQKFGSFPNHGSLFQIYPWNFSHDCFLSHKKLF